MEYKIVNGESEAVTFAKELAAADNTVEVYKLNDGVDAYKVVWIKNKKFISRDGCESTDEVWTTANGELIVVQDLDPEHAKNIIRMILRNARQNATILSSMEEFLKVALDKTDEDEMPRVLH